MPKKPQDRKPKLPADSVVIKTETLDAVHARWEETRRNQIAVINRLQGIINLARETASSPSLSPEEALHEIKEILK